MGKYLILWRLNPLAPAPQDPTKLLQLYERAWAAVDGLIKKGEITDMTSFMDGNSGYAIAKTDSATLFKNINMFSPYWTCEVKEVMPFDQAKEVWRAGMKAQIEAAKK